MQDLKRMSAVAGLDFIQNGFVVGLGGGRSVAHLIDLICEKGLNVQIVTPSDSTRALCIEQGLAVLPTAFVDTVDVAFDGCNEVDSHFSALKSGGGIHTQEKLIGSMANRFIILADDEKFVDTLTYSCPVSLEVIPEAMAYVLQQTRVLGGEPLVRKSTAKDGYTRTDNGNILIDVTFPSTVNSRQLQSALLHICGVVETSLFIDVVTDIIIASSTGVKIISKTKELN